METSEIVARLRAVGCVFAEDEARLLQETAVDQDHLRVMLDRRVEGEPLEHVLGWAEFAGRRVAVDPGVFRPRPRTEFLVEHAASLVPPSGSPPASQQTDATKTGSAGRSDRPAVVVLDICCGTGALGLALATRLDAVELHASDLDHLAVACARRNIEPVGGRVYQGDLFAALPDGLRGRVDVILANVPYVPTSALDLMPAEARWHEPVGSLDGGLDGLDVLRRVAAEATHWQAPGGYLLTEVSVGQAQPAAEVLRSAGLAPTVVTSEEHDATVVVGRR